jgi:UDP-2-acetamido-3-amino-2,3-dideoxy-glucuronate N-acetyltransferase
MQITGLKQQKAKVTVVGVGYWGKNLVRNFHDLGALSALCDPSESAEAACRHQYGEIAFQHNFKALLFDPQITAFQSHLTLEEVS